MDNSPFHRLPAEIRDAIYTLVLGGNDIHVRNMDDLMSYSICTEPVSHYDAIRAIKNRPMHDSNFPKELDHYRCSTHDAKTGPAPTRLHLALLQTCRQIHAEAAPIPFKANTFVLSNPIQLRYFGNSLTKMQREAVASICLVTSYLDSRCFGLGDRILRLNGIHRLAIVLGVPNRTTSDEIERFLVQAAEGFGRRSLVAVDILVRFRRSKSSADELRARHERCSQWAHDTEQALLKPVNESAMV